MSNDVKNIFDEECPNFINKFKKYLLEYQDDTNIDKKELDRCTRWWN